jgi:hypothetical protein
MMRTISFYNGTSMIKIFACVVALMVITLMSSCTKAKVKSAQDGVSQSAVEVETEDEHMSWVDKIWEKIFGEMKPGYIRDFNPPTKVRNRRSRKSFVVHYLDDGTFIYYTPDESGWYRVYDENKIILGYVHKSFIRPSN